MSNIFEFISLFSLRYYEKNINYLAIRNNTPNNQT